MEICKICNCNNRIVAKGLCNKHYQRMQIHGDPNVLKIRIRGICSVDGCGKPHCSKGYCSTHYAKIKRSGTLDWVRHGQEWKQKMSESLKSKLSRIDSTPDPKHRGYLAVNIVNDLKYKAIQRGKKWSLTNIEAYQLIIAPCYYCGHVPNWPKERVGIDRVNNKLHYTPKNCVSCCFTCNTAKGVLGANEFKSWVKRLYENLLSKSHITDECSHPDQTDFGAEIWCNLCRKANF